MRDFDDKKTIVKEVKEPVKEPEAPVAVKEPIVEKVDERSPLVLVSHDDAYISDRMKSQPKTLDAVLQVKEREYAPGEHRLSLPKELKEYQDRFTFYWINKNKRSIDEALNIRGWILVNKALFPNLPKHLYASSGAVERGSAILGFMAKTKAEAYRRNVHIKSESRKKSNIMLNPPKVLPKGQSGYYKPEDSSGDDDRGYQEGRDF